jgi:hypothetical protein
MGEDLEGLIIYSPDGYMSGQMMKPGRPAYASGDMEHGTTEELAVIDDVICNAVIDPATCPSGRLETANCSHALLRPDRSYVSLAFAQGSHVRQLGRRPSAPWTWSTAWQLRGVDSSEVGRVQALANAR